ncbi:MAG: TatD family hydrolase [Elusimicrobiota bacterium]|jgi:phosphotriesterase-related protein|nr:TatD family hydrolase [Elusimicrobiota bacterium]
MKLQDGYTLMHEHITIDLSAVKKDPDARLDCFTQTVEELKKLKKAGVSNILDVTNIGMGRHPFYVKKAAKESEINILQSTGFYKEPFLPEIVYSKTEKELAEIMLKEINESIDENESNPKAYCIGEIGTSKDEMTAVEKKVFQAAIIAAKNSTVPIYTHTTLGTYAYEQAVFFIENGIAPERIIIGHIDLSKDLDYIKKVLDTGVFVGFDTIGKDNYFSDEDRSDFLIELEKEGRLNKIVLSLDITRKSHLEEFGGIGYSHLFTKFLPMLRKKGMKEESIDQMLIHNPKTILEQK